MQSPREIVQAAIDAGWTQSKIAAESGVPQATISRILSGENDPRFSTVEKLLAIKVKKPRRAKAAPAPAIPEDAPAEPEAA
ncbi:helix-turn-helix domain-containing protein [Ralstonia pickettii]|uniref:helix-turn-helix domain-containing protein n=1 Tax=Ralstonia pickettii TaxID=329 RepID=UPI001C723708|nr:helix-turn-helix domain-containing protein [Ralstonia pickettii]MBX4004311.1 helix-turn-helix domain-containing protein [Ralstonia pickettii]MBX4028160.1 helix-turn-helix domain-containing protein [Ralstonia pickettii]MBX4072747.1 helix-turn-helix domain-containing protein [Ralstonia pickettii]MBX4077704.1 helix-turn-helix domain-containing protein [Ralstonia pickettii]MBX4090709.1 helix-turn-helix domain-containing protein [Ralstonia pickettii]